MFSGAGPGFLFIFKEKYKELDSPE